MAKDPRPIIVHEGVPGHYAQLWLVLEPRERDPAPLRRLGVQRGHRLLRRGDDAPGRPLRRQPEDPRDPLQLHAPARLARGGRREARDRRVHHRAGRRLPLAHGAHGPGTAHDEAALFASTPGQAITYQIGQAPGAALPGRGPPRAGRSPSTLRAFHDFVWKNGNVPIALQQWEYLAGEGAKPPAY